MIAIDMCEVDPVIDTSGRTEWLAMTAIMELVGNRILTIDSPYTEAELRSVFYV
jgi:hypothetical protein